MTDAAIHLSDVHAGGSITITGVTVGLSPDAVRELVEAAAAGAVGPLADKIVLLSHRLGLTEHAAHALLRVLSAEPVADEALPDALARAANQIQLMRSELSRPRNDDRELAELRAKAIAAIDAGLFDEAANILKTIRAAEKEFSEAKRVALENARGDWLESLRAQATTCELQARAAFASRRFGECIAFCEEGYAILEPVGGEALQAHAVRAALLLHGDLDKPDDPDWEALEGAVPFYERALAGKDCAPLPDRPDLLNRLGLAQLVLGNRDDTFFRDPLEAALRALDGALELWPRDTHAPEWTATQFNRGVALTFLRLFEGGHDRLETAASSFEAVLEAFDSRGDRSRWGDKTIRVEVPHRAVARSEEILALVVQESPGQGYHNEGAYNRPGELIAETLDRLSMSLIRLGNITREPRHFERALTHLRKHVKCKELGDDIDRYSASEMGNLGGALYRLGAVTKNVDTLQLAARCTAIAYDAVSRSFFDMPFANDMWLTHFEIAGEIKALGATVAPENEIREPERAKPPKEGHRRRGHRKKKV